METQHLDAVVANHTQDMSDRVVAVTGTTSGTGFVLAREAARAGATVILLNRDSPRAEAALAQLKQAVPGATFDAVTCDLQDFDSVRSAVEDIVSRYDVVDVLCNNAGVMALPDHATKDGYDVQMQTNCISHFLLTSGLFALIKKSRDGRIVNHTSMARLGPPLEARYFGKNGGSLGGDGSDEENASFAGPRWARYHQTKLANCAFTYGLKQQLDGRGIENVKVLLAHPGLAATNLQVTTTQTGGMAQDSPLMTQAQTAEDGALGIIRACMDPEAKSGDFFGPKQFTGFPDRLQPEPSIMDEATIRVNWEGCQAAVGPFQF